ncbi:outer membrane protein [Pontibaca salina]|uniref:Porin n=1 Tax=Pontibaca salina TaxID=2795731 RepID=A0A934HKL9_9RHOB|nr:porin [Pontibaca salina]MBI6629914.1 porin [Pontibaca salina]
MKKLIVAAASAGMIASTIALPATAQDGSGLYFGLGLGWTDVDGPGGDNGATYGAHIGYDLDFGQFVVGGELEYERTDIGLLGSAGDIDNIGRVKVKGGYDFGPFMGYAVLGRARMKTSFGNDNGNIYGLGMSYAVNDRVSLGGELLRHDFNNFAGTTTDYDADSLTFRASFRF